MGQKDSNFHYRIVIGGEEALVASELNVRQGKFQEVCKEVIRALGVLREEVTADKVARYVGNREPFHLVNKPLIVASFIIAEGESPEWE